MTYFSRESKSQSGGLPTLAKTFKRASVSVYVTEVLLFFFFQIIDPKGFCKLLNAFWTCILVSNDTNTYLHIQKCTCIQ